MCVWELDMNSTSALCLQENKPCTCVRHSQDKTGIRGKKITSEAVPRCLTALSRTSWGMVCYDIFKRVKHVVIIAFCRCTAAKLSPTFVTLEQPFFFSLFAYLASQHSVTWHGSCSRIVLCHRNMTYRSRAEKGRGKEQTAKMHETGSCAWFKNC